MLDSSFSFYATFILSWPNIAPNFSLTTSNPLGSELKKIQGWFWVFLFIFLEHLLPIITCFGPPKKASIMARKSSSASSATDFLELHVVYTESVLLQTQLRQLTVFVGPFLQATYSSAWYFELWGSAAQFVSTHRFGYVVTVA